MVVDKRKYILKWWSTPKKHTNFAIIRYTRSNRFNEFLGEPKTNIRKPRYTIMGSSRPMLTTSQRMQRRETLVHSAIASNAKTSAEAAKGATTKVRPSMARPPMGRQSVARQSVARPSMARPSIARPSMAAPSAAAQSTARPPIAHSSMARPSVAKTSMAPPSSLPTRSIARPTTTASSATASANPPAANHRPQQRPQAKALAAPKPSRKTVAPPKPPSNATQSQCNEPSKCTYCDKTFVKGLAFKLHLLNNCEKIPATQRRLLQDTRPASSNSKPLVTVVGRTRSSQLMPNRSRFFLDVTNGAAAAAEAGARRSDTGLGALAANMKRLPNTFSGVTRTPSKSIKCHICRRAFLNCAEYAMHVVEHQYERQTLDVD